MRLYNACLFGYGEKINCAILSYLFTMTKYLIISTCLHDID